MLLDFDLLDGWRDEMQGHAYTALDASESALGALQGQASELVAAFRAKRESLREQAQVEVDARTAIGRRAKKIYAPLNLFTRVRGRGLELVWQEVHRNRVTHTLRFKSLRLSADGNADLRLLLSRALPFELELIRDTEEHARRIRAQWKRWGHIGNEAARALHLADEFLLTTKKSGPWSPTDPGALNVPKGDGLHEWIPAAN